MFIAHMLPSIMPQLEEILNSQDFELWTLNQEQETRGLKKEAKKYLDLFISSIESYQVDQLDLITLTLCEQQENSGLKIKHNLFEKVIYPNLIKNALEGKPDYYRLLATFEQYFNSSNKLSSDAAEKLKLNEKYVDSIELLELELADNNNQKAAILLINKLGWHLDYALHELPIGLLYQPTLIEEFCYKIESLINEYGIKQDKWNERLNYVRTTLTEWELFQSKPRSQDFFEHLNTQQTENTSLILEWNEALYDYQEI